MTSATFCLDQPTVTDWWITDTDLVIEADGGTVIGALDPQDEACHQILGATASISLALLDEVPTTHAEVQAWAEWLSGDARWQ